MKFCVGCQTTKEFSEFNKGKANKDGLGRVCRSCCSKDSARRYIENREAKIEKSRIWQQKNKEHRRKYLRDRKHRKLATDPQFKLAHRLRTRVYQALKGYKKSASTVALVGCTPADLKIYLEEQFEDGMTWQNWGSGPGKWNIDHIHPLALVDLTDPRKQHQAFNYLNLRPRWWLPNISAGGSIAAQRRKLLRAAA